MIEQDYEQQIQQETSRKGLKAFIAKNFLWLTLVLVGVFVFEFLLILDSAFSLYVPLRKVVMICLIDPLVLSLLIIAILVLDAIIRNRNSELSYDQQLVAGLGSWAIRALVAGVITATVALISFLTDKITGHVNDNWNAFLIAFVIIFVSLWALYFVLRLVVPLPKDQDYRS